MVTLIRDRLRDEDQARKVMEGGEARTGNKARRQNKDMMPDERMGIMGVPLFPCLSAGDFAPPQLHGQMGLTNAILERFFQFIDDKVEVVTEDEKKARSENWKALEDMKDKQQTRMEIKAEYTSAFKKLKVNLRIAQQHLKKASNDEEEEQHLAVVMLEADTHEMEETIKEAVDGVIDAKAVNSKWAQLLKELKAARGCTIDSIIATIEEIFAEFGITHQSYHGGDFNSVSCRRLVKHIKKIMSKVSAVIMKRKDDALSDNEAKKTMTNFLKICGLIDAAFTALSIIDPTDAEMDAAEANIKRLSLAWCEEKLSMNLKAHILEHHYIPFVRKFGGIGDYDESFIELAHQEGDRRAR
jgi:hypothetical protein